MYGYNITGRAAETARGRAGSDRHRRRGPGRPRLSRARSRRHLRLVLDDPRVLADLGLTPEEADLESLKPFWR